MAQMNLFTEKKIMDLENRLVVAKGEGEGVDKRGKGKRDTYHMQINGGLW